MTADPHCKSCGSSLPKGKQKARKVAELKKQRQELEAQLAAVLNELVQLGEEI